MYIYTYIGKTHDNDDITVEPLHQLYIVCLYTVHCLYKYNRNNNMFSIIQIDLLFEKRPRG